MDFQLLLYVSYNNFPCNFEGHLRRDGDLNGESDKKIYLRKSYEREVNFWIRELNFAFFTSIISSC